MKVRCVCDLCKHGDHNNKQCYKKGFIKCYVNNGYYKDFELDMENIQIGIDLANGKDLTATLKAKGE
jgi:hypothetical protein